MIMEPKADEPSEQADASMEHADVMETKEVRRRKKQFYGILRRQMEFYFSDANLTKNRFMGKRVLEDPNVDLSLFLGFNKIRALTGNTADIVNALRKSKLLAVTEDGTKVYRTTPVEEKKNSDDCTIYVELLPPDAEHEWLRSVFLPYGEVPYVSIPKYSVSHANKGFAFVEFDTPESADRALAAFGAMGCRIPTQIAPDQLCSSLGNDEYRNAGEEEEAAGEDIFREEKSDEANKVKSPEEGDCADEGPSTKRLKTDKVEVVESSETSSGVEEIVDDIKVEQCEEKLPRKRKMMDSNDDATKAKSKKLDKEESNCPEEDSGSRTEANGEEKENEDEEKGKKKSRRHKKKAKKEDHDVDPRMSLRILPKSEWKRLRNKYLSLQKSKMMSLKQHLARSRWGNNYSQEPRDYYHYGSQRHEESEKEPVKEKPAEKPVKQFSFIPGVIVHVSLEEPVGDVKAFKASARTHPEVLYVDLEEGASEAHIRCGSADAAKRLASDRQWRKVQVLSGEEETQYWEKITRDRDQKLGGVVEGRKKGKRGREKLLKRAEKALGKHIRFDEHE